jgi:hypothetical protein
MHAQASSVCAHFLNYIRTGWCGIPLPCLQPYHFATPMDDAAAGGAPPFPRAWRADRWGSRARNVLKNLPCKQDGFQLEYYLAILGGYW